MTRPTLLSAIVELLRSAGATEEIIAAAVGAAGAFENAPRRPRGRRRHNADSAACKRAWRRRDEIRDEIQTPRKRTFARIGGPTVRCCVARRGRNALHVTLMVA